ncbi:MAG TPA: NADPH-dependent FMN reductase [Ktedonobacteraceae bacterium]|nr:NADPH-dependent FMN reductase [Ktedonobacteraceae bacterium]
MRILAISGSLRASSTNSALVRATIALAPEDIECLIYTGLAELPHFSPEIDDEKSPATVVSLREQLKAADGIIICTPEYAFGVPGSLKNALDWTVSTGDLWDKPVAAISASPLATGGDKAHASLLLTLKALGAKVPENAKLTVPIIKKKLNAEGEISDPETKQALQTVMDTLVQAMEHSAITS